jgi:hypothetical protein
MKKMISTRLYSMRERVHVCVFVSSIRQMGWRCPYKTDSASENLKARHKSFFGPARVQIVRRGVNKPVSQCGPCPRCPPQAPSIITSLMLWAFPSSSFIPIFISEHICSSRPSLSLFRSQQVLLAVVAIESAQKRYDLHQNTTIGRARLKEVPRQDEVLVTVPARLV